MQIFASELSPTSPFTQFAEVTVPGGFAERLTYGVPASTMVQCGSVVWVPLARRKTPLLALVREVHSRPPSFPIKPLSLHASQFCFSPNYLQLLEWISRFYCCEESRTLDALWPADLSHFLDQLVQRTKGLRKRKLSQPIENAPLPPLTTEQSQAIESLEPLLLGQGFRGALLHGVTGSGKTRVYGELVRSCVALGKKALILVPEIALTPQTHFRFQSMLQTEVLLLHSNLSAPEKRHSWTTLLQGNAQVVLGTRSALLAPGLEPDLIIIDEEHDASYKQQDPAPRYHCREVAFHWAHKRGAFVLLGSATPSLETWDYAQKGHLRLIPLRERALPVELPHIRIVDMRKEVHQDRELQLSPLLREEITDTIAQGFQAIILHNRRGFATSRTCTHCGETLECRHCKVPVVLHRQHKALMCHYCGLLYPINEPCPHCHSRSYQFLGGGIEKVEEELLRWIPGAKVIRMDRDSVQNIGAAEQILNSFRNQEYNILLGTQMVAKGHDFPKVQLVGVISADMGSTLPDFRSGERTFQLLTQVAGRAGRAQAGAQVILQSWNPSDPVFRFALRHDYLGFAQWELSNRQALRYPPFSRLLALEVQGKNPPQLDEACNAIFKLLTQSGDIQVLGPTDAFIAMVRGVHRKQFLLKGPNPNALRQAIQPLSQWSQAGIHLRFDIDPLSIL